MSAPFKAATFTELPAASVSCSLTSIGWLIGLATPPPRLMAEALGRAGAGSKSRLTLATPGIPYRAAATSAPIVICIGWPVESSPVTVPPLGAMTAEAIAVAAGVAVAVAAGVGLAVATAVEVGVTGPGVDVGVSVGVSVAMTAAVGVFAGGLELGVRVTGAEVGEAVSVITGVLVWAAVLEGVGVALGVVVWLAVAVAVTVAARVALGEGAGVALAVLALVGVALGVAVSIGAVTTYMVPVMSAGWRLHR